MRFPLCPKSSPKMLLGARGFDDPLRPDSRFSLAGIDAPSF